MCLIGADPELFIKDNKGNSIPAVGIVPGDKKNPHKVSDGAVQVDGLALEFNITPSDDANVFIDRIHSVMDSLRLLVPRHMSFDISPVAHFDEAVMASLPDDAKKLGCDPDFNAWTMNPNPRPDQHPTMRTAAGHIHIGWTEGMQEGDFAHFADCAAVARQLDAYVGIPLLLIEPDSERRSMYGAAGAFRPKTYGCEYRVPSNHWLTSNELKRWIFRQARNAFYSLTDGGSVEGRYDYQDIIGRNDKDAAYQVICELGLPMPKGFSYA